MIDATASSPSGLERWAPFGVPVVPEVRITKRGLSGGGFRFESSFSAISESRVGPSASPSVQPITRVTLSSTPSSRPANSSSWTSTFGPSRRVTSTSCGPANIVLR